MTVWSHLSTIFAWQHVLHKLCSAILIVVVLTTVLFAVTADAAPSNQTISFSARLKNSAGSVVPDGYYNIRFKLYSQQSGGSAVWTETYHDANGVSDGQDNRVKVTNGYLSVKLGSLANFTGVDWTGDLWMTMDVGGTSQVTSPAWDGEMDPRIQLSAVPYAMNAQTLGGKSADEFLQVGSGVQDLGNETSIAINKTGSGDLMQFQSSGADVFTLSNTGSITLGSSADQTISIAESTASDGRNLTLAAGSATSGDSAGGDLILQAGSGSGTGADGTIVMESNLSVGAGQTITMVGGATSLRPASPAEGTLYFDTDTKELLVYANGKWQGDGTTSTKIIAASNSTQANKDGADYVTDGTADDVEINAAIASLPSTGGVIFLSAGTYTISAPIAYSKSNVTIQGEGEYSTTITRAFNSAASEGVINMTNSNATLKQLAINGNKSSYTSTNNIGIYMSGYSTEGHSVEHVRVYNAAGSGLRTDGYAGNKSSISNSQFSGSNEHGIITDNPQEMIITNNRIFNNASRGISGGGNAALTITNNDVYSNGSDGISARGLIANNSVRDNVGTGILGTSSQGATVTGNIVTGNFIGISIPNQSNDVTVSNNRIVNSTREGIFIDSGSNASRGNVTGNIIKDSGRSAIRFTSTASNSLISSNQIYEYGGSGTYYGIEVNGTGKDVTVSNNTIFDSVGSGNAILIGSGRINTHLEANVLQGDGANGIADSSSSTTYSNQLDGNGKLLNRSSGGFGVQTSSGSDAITIDSTSGSVSIAGTLDTTSATALNIGTTNATSINLGQDTVVAGSLEADSIESSSLDTASAGSLALGSTNATSVTIGAGNSNGTILVLGKRTTAGDPAGTEGAMYYSSAAGKFRCYQAGGWVDCVTPLPVSKVVDSTVNISDTPGDVTGLSFSLAANTKYYYKFVIMNDSDTSSNGIGFGITAPENIVTSNWCANTNTSKDSNESDQPGIGTYCGTDDVYTLVEGTTTPSNSRVTNIEGYLETGSSTGDLQLRAQADLGSGQTIREGSFGILQIVQ